MIGIAVGMVGKAMTVGIVKTMWRNGAALEQESRDREFVLETPRDSRYHGVEWDIIQSSNDYSELKDLGIKLTKENPNKAYRIRGIVP